MNWTSVTDLYGLKRPFNFRVAIPFLLNALVLAVTLIACAVLTLRNDLFVGTERFYFLFYIVALLLLAIAISRYPIASYTLLVWCTVELLLAVTTSAYLPKNELVQPVDPRFGYHPLLQNVPKPNVEWKWHVSEREIALAKAEYTNIAFNWAAFENQDFIFHQNALGIRGPEVNAADLRKPLIFIYGGSTTYDISVSQGKTWVERLQAALNGKYTILNFGVPGYSTTEHLIQTIFYQDIAGKKPVCDLYYVGWNDLHNAHTSRLDSAYANFHLPLQAVRSPDLYFAKFSPFVMLVGELAKQRFDSLPPQPSLGALGQPVPGPDKRLEEIFVDHINTIKAVNEGRGIRTVFIGQMLNREFFKGRRPPETWTPLVRYEDMWPLQARLNELLKKTAMAGTSAPYIDAGIDNFSASDFTDEGHFSEAGAQKFSSLIADQVDHYCK
jgi:hypothetical protein